VDDKRLIKTSKYLSRHLRHRPERLGLTLEPGGWVRVSDLLDACAAQGFALSAEGLREVVARNDKRRLSYDDTGVRIRANQGHSVDVDLELVATAPPELLFHGTGAGNVEAIMRGGLQRRRRHHVHLSADRETARRVGARHGRPVVFDVAAGRMHVDGHPFFVSDNGVWLTDEVPPAYLDARESA